MARHFDTYCHGLLSDLPRKSVEPIALAAGTAVRTLQEFLVTSNWDHDRARDQLQRRLAEALAELPPDPLGVVGVIDETSAVKKGDKTPGVQRQYLGCVGKIDHGVVTVHVGVTQAGSRPCSIPTCTCPSRGPWIVRDVETLASPRKSSTGRSGESRSINCCGCRPMECGSTG